MEDSFAYLVDVGIPLERIQKHMRDGLSCDEMAAAVQGMLDRGIPIDEILSEEKGEALVEDGFAPLSLLSRRMCPSCQNFRQCAYLQR